jgi:hypothetical protein
MQMNARDCLAACLTDGDSPIKNGEKPPPRFPSTADFYYFIVSFFIASSLFPFNYGPVLA